MGAVGARGVALLTALDPLTIALLLALSFAGFVITSAVGIGAAIFLVPLFMFGMPAAHAVSLAAPITLAGNLTRAWMLRRHVHRRAAWICVVTSGPISAVAALYTVDVDARYLELFVAAIIAWSLALEWRRPDVLRMGDTGLALSGAVSGVLSGLGGLAGPPGAIALRAYGLTQESFVATLSIWGVALQALKIPAYMRTGAMPNALWPLALALSALSLLGAVIATRWLRHMNVRLFRTLLNGMLALIALVLVVRGFSR